MRPGSSTRLVHRSRAVEVSSTARDSGWHEAEALAGKVRAPEVLRESLNRLATALGFNETDTNLLV